jgi:hypothetical protein
MVSPHNDSDAMKTETMIFLLVGAVAACATTSPTLDGTTDAGSLTGAKVEITAEGGFAALSVTHRLEHDSRAFSYSQRRLCGTSCGTPADSASGTLSPAKTDSVFNVVLQDARALTKDDYGITRNGADMMSYTIRITSGGHIRTIHADDGTLPDPARQLLAAVRETISAARGR